MNKVFSTVWNAALGQLVVASELARGQKKGAKGTTRAHRGRRVLKGVAVAGAMTLAGTASAAWDLQVDGSLGFTVPDNGTVNFVPGDNIDLTSSGNAITVATVESPEFGNITINDGNSGKITGVTDGDVSSGSTEVVTGGQLFSTNQNVDQNASDISTNAATIGTNTSDISDNTSAIDTNTAGISTNTADIGTNTSDISANRGDIDTNTNSIASNTTQVGVNTTDISDLQTSVSGGWTLEGDTGSEAIKPGDTATIAGGANIDTDLSNGTLTVKTVDSPEFGGIKINDNGKITGVTGGSISENSDEVVTGSQIYERLLGDGGGNPNAGTRYFHAHSTEADSQASGDNSIAIGPETTVDSTDGLAAGHGALVDTGSDAAMALGKDASVGTNSAGAIAFGDKASVASVANHGIAMGTAAQATAADAVALGHGASADSSAVALGSSTSAAGANAVGAGTSARADAYNSLALGTGAQALTHDSISLGTNAGKGTVYKSPDDGKRHSHIAIGENAGQDVEGNESIAIGVGAGSGVKNDYNVAIGSQAGTNINGERNVALGYKANEQAAEVGIDHATAIGGLTQARSNAVALGYKAQANNGGVSIGEGSGADSHGVALGQGAQANGSFVALGQNSIATSSDVSGAGYLTGAGFSGSAVSVGNSSTDLYRRITNVADGAQDHDAVTVAQLKALKDDLGSFTPTSGGNANYNSDGTLSVADAVSDGEAVNLGQMNQAISDSEVEYFSVDPNGDTSNQDNAGASGANSMAIGHAAQTQGDSSLAVGHNARVTESDRATSLGYATNAKADNSTAIGSESTVDDEAGVAIGRTAYSRGDNSLAMGTDAQTGEKDSGGATSNNAIAFGTSSRATDDDASALGHSATATGKKSTAIGFEAHAENAESAFALGTNALANAENAHAAGTDAHALAGNAFASGTGATASGSDSIASGTQAKANTANAIAMGHGAESGFAGDPANNVPATTNTIAIGNGDSTVYGQGSLAVGNNNKVGAKDANDPTNIVMAGNNAGAFGNHNTIQRDNNFVVGNNNIITAEGVENTFVLGSHVTPSQGNSVVLGNKSTDRAATSESEGSYTTPNGTITFSDYAGVGDPDFGIVSVGHEGEERQLINVAAGKVSAESTDAVNGSQLFATNKVLGNVASTTVDILGGNAALGSDGKITMSDIGGTGKNTIEEAIPASRTKLTAGTNVASVNETETNGHFEYTIDADGSTVSAGAGMVVTDSGPDSDNVTDYQVALSQDTQDDIGKGVAAKESVDTKGLTFTGDNGSTDVEKLGDTVAVNGDNNIATTANGDAITVALNKDLTGLDSVTFNDGANGNTVSLDKNGLDNGGNTITNVGDGAISSSSSEAINGSQLQSGNDSLADNVLGGDAVYDGSNNSWDMGNDIGGTGQSTIDDAIKSASTAANAGWTVADADNNSNNIGPNGTVTFNGDSNIVVAESGADDDGKIQVTLNRDLDVDSVTMGDTTINGNGLIINNGPSITNSGIDAGGQVITNVADGTVAPGSKDAVNGSQLNDVKGTADSALQSFTTAVNGTTAQTIDQTDNQANFKNGQNIKVTGDGTGITVATADDVNFDSVTAGHSTLDDNGVTITGGSNGDVILGNDGLDNGGNTITGVADGAINSGSSEAINGSQLQSGNDSLADNVLGGDASYDGNTNSWDMGSDIGGTGESTIDDAIKSANTAANAGWTVADANGSNNNIGPNGQVTFDGDSNITVTESGSDDDATIQVELNDDIDVNSVTTGNSVLNTGGLTVDDGTNSTVYGADGLDINGGDVVVDGTGLTIANGPSVTAGGIDAGDQAITGVADGAIGSNSDQAINGSQLQAMGDSLAGDVLGGDANYDGASNSWDMGNDIGGTGQSTIDDAIASANDAANAGWDLTAQGNNSTNVGPGDSVDLNNSDGNIAISKTGTDNDVTFDLADAIDVATSVTVGDSTLDTNGLTVNDGTNNTIYGADGLTIAGGPSVTTGGIDAGDQAITGVGDGAISSSSTDAINGSQLQGAGDSLAGDVLGGNAQYDGANNQYTMTDIGGTGENTIDEAIKSANTAANAGWTVADANGSNNNIGPNGQVMFDGDSNITVTESGSDDDAKIQVELSDDIDVNSVTAGNSVLNTGGLTVDDGTNSTVYGADGLDINGGDVVVDGTGLTIANGPSVTAGGIDAGDQAITGVADGAIGSNSDQAINGSQLQALGDSLAGDVLGGDANYDGASNSWDMGNDIGGTGQSTIDEAIASTNDAATAGWNLSGDGSNQVNIGPAGDVDIAGDSNISIAQSGSDDAGQIDITLNKNIDLGSSGSVTTGNSVLDNGGLTVDDGSDKTEYGADGLTIAGGPSVTTGGIDAGHEVISNVADGAISSSSSEAINGSQLQAMGDSLAGDVLGGDANYDGDTNSWDMGNDIGGTGQSTIDEAIASTNDAANAGWDLTAQGNNSTNVGPGDSVDLNNSDGNIDISKTGTDNDVTFDLADAIDVATSVTVGDSTLDTNGLTIDDGAGNTTIVSTGGTQVIDGTNTSTYGPAGSTITDGTHTTTVGPETITLAGGPNNDVILGNDGLDNGGNTITGVADGTISSSSSEAINGSQLYALGDSAEHILGGDAKYDTNTGELSMSDIGGTGENNINDAIKQADSGWTITDGANNDALIKHGKVTLTGDSNIAVEQTGTDDDGQIEIALNKNVDLGSSGSVTMGGTVMNNDGLTTGNGTGPSITTGGIDAADTKITNVQDGTVAADSKDAVNGGQLYAAQDELTTKGLDFTGNDDSAGTVHRELGQTLAIKGGNVTGGSYSGDNLKTVTDPTTGGIELQLADNPAFDSVVTGNSTLNNEGLKVNDGAETTMVDAGVVTVVGSGGTVAVNGDTGTVNGLANRTFDPDDYTSGQAATEDQLNAVYEIANSGWTVADASGNSNNIGPGGQVTFDGDDNVTVSESGDDDDAKVQVALNDDINVVSVTTGDASTGVYSTLTDAGLTVVNGANPSGTTYGADGMRIANGPSVTSSGVDAGGKKITNVKAGDISATSTDAVNGSQLHQTNQNVSDLGDQVDNITDGASGMFQVSQDNNDPQPDPSGEDSVAGGAGATASGDHSVAVGNDSLAEGDQSTALGNASEALGEDSTALGNGAVASKDGSTAVGQGSQASGDNSTALGQGAEATGDNSVALGQGAVADEDNVVSVGSDGNERKVTHVADGEVSETSTDAVNGSQLQAVKDTANAGWNLTTNGDVAGKSNVGPDETVDFSTDDNIEVSHNGNDVKFELADDIKVGSVTAGNSFLGGNGLTIDDGDGNVTQTTATGTTVADGAGNTTVISAGGTTVSNAGGDSTRYGADGMHIEDGPSVTVDGIDGGGQKITNVAPGTADSDVATMGQLNLHGNEIKNWSKNYTDMRFNQLGRDMHDLDRDLRGGVASAMAMASLPQAYQPGQSSAAVAVGNYRGESGLAVGLSTVTDSGHYVFKLNLTGNTRGDFGVGAGAAIMW